MFVRKIQNPSGSISVQVISKKNGKYRMIKSFGSTNDSERLAQLLLAAQEYADNPSNQRSLFFALAKEDLTVQNFLENLSNLQVRAIGPELIFGALFDRIGFNVVPDQLFRHIVIARLVYPASKLKTADYLYRYRGIIVSDETIYRFLDKLNEKYKEAVEQIAFEYTERTLKNIAIVFYDMTTLYFETEDEDDLRKIGFSKDGKFQNPQIMLGLLVGENGYPIGYDIFKGNTFEGHTLLPILEQIQKKYGFEKPIVVADTALLTKKNNESLIKEKYQFILGARIKNEAEEIKNKILKKAGNMKSGDIFFIRKPDDTKLVISYSDKRKRKDAYNRERGLRKLKERVKSGKLTKENINSRGYNKFLSLTGKIDIKIDEDKINEDKKWDGLKGYITNTRISSKKAVENYRHLWQIEKAFRISKTDLRIRPVHHYLQRRIEAHICIAFVAYAIYKELERLLDKHKAGFSPKRATELTHNMYEVEYTFPHSKRKAKTLLKMDREQQSLYNIIHK